MQGCSSEVVLHFTRGLGRCGSSTLESALGRGNAKYAHSKVAARGQGTSTHRQPEGGAADAAFVSSICAVLAFCG